MIEEDDRGSLLSMDVTDPSLAPIVVTLRTGHDALRKKGIVDVARANPERRHSCTSIDARSQSAFQQG